MKEKLYSSVEGELKVANSCLDNCSVQWKCSYTRQ